MEVATYSPAVLAGVTRLEIDGVLMALPDEPAVREGSEYVRYDIPLSGAAAVELMGDLA